MRALVISGGAAKGAFAGGVAEYLIKEKGYEYDIVVGSSTGSLLVPLLAIGKVDKLKKVYQSVRNEDIFSVSPVKIAKRVGQDHISIHHWNIIRMFLRRKKTFGDSTKLKELIRQTFTLEDYTELLERNKKVVVTVSNLSFNLVEYKHLRDCTYDEFVDWMWISCNIVPFMSLAVRNGMEYGDGGFGDTVPIREAIDQGAKEIDIVILNPKYQMEASEPSKNAFGTLFKTFDFMLRQIGSKEVYTSYLEGLRHGIKSNYYYTPRLLSSNYFVFDPEQMTQWWVEGYEVAKKKNEERL